jgi:hypothetical protein
MNIYLSKIIAVSKNNKYTNIYIKLIERAQTKFPTKSIANKLGIKVEKHHIFPRSFGGDDTKANLVYLTTREHFIAHLVMTKMFENEFHWKMINALWFMSNKSQYGNRKYAWLKEAHVSSISKRYSGRKLKPLSEETKKKISEAKKGKKWIGDRKEQSMKVSKAKTGIKRGPLSEEWRKNLSESIKGRKVNRTAEHQTKLNATKFGRIPSAETRKKMSDAKTEIYELHFPTGEIEIFKGLKLISEKFQISPITVGTILHRCEKLNIAPKKGAMKGLFLKKLSHTYTKCIHDFN